MRREGRGGRPIFDSLSVGVGDARGKHRNLQRPSHRHVLRDYGIENSRHQNRKSFLREKDVSEFFPENRRTEAGRPRHHTPKSRYRTGLVRQRTLCRLNPPNAVIAIDGTSASGKSSTARAVAKALGYIYVDTGAMYRTLAWHCLQKQVDIHDPAAVAKLCRDWNASLSRAGNEVRLLVDGYFPEQEIRTKQVTEATPVAASVPEEREWMMQKQRECAQFGNLVMEGRDIGTHIFPATPHKFFLDACANERARRRAAQGVAENV